MKLKGTNNEILDLIYQELKNDSDWDSTCRSMLETSNFDRAQYNCIPHYWEFSYKKMTSSRPTCMEFIEENNVLDLSFNLRYRTSQHKDWRYDEAFAMRQEYLTL